MEPMDNANILENQAAARGKSRSLPDAHVSHALRSLQESASSCLVGREIQSVAFEDGMNSVSLKMDYGYEVFI